MRRDNDRIDPCAGKDAPADACARPPLERLRFWNGRFLVARDLRHQQDDLVRRIEYHQRHAHGTGIVCGFRVRPHPREECRPRWVVVSPGMAYDCCGRTLWMPEPTLVELPLPGGGGRRAGGCGEADVHWPRGEERPEADPAGEGDGGGSGEEEAASHGEERPAGEAPEEEAEERPQEEAPEGEDVWEGFLAIRRCDRPTDPLPALYADDLCDPVRHEHGRIREEVEVVVLSPEEVSEACWPRPRPVEETDCTREVEDDCHRSLGDIPPCPGECPCGEFVIVARLEWSPRRGVLAVDTTHVRILTPPRDLTRIDGVNWPHGEELTVGELLEERGGRLVVRFSRPLRPAEALARGINARTFTVSYLTATGALEQILPPDPEDLEEGEHPSPRLSENRRCAIFRIPDELLKGRTSIAGSLIHVTLRCDFVLDCHGRAVSGAHLAGDVNGRGTGDGVPGGLFESWFYLTQD